MLGNLRIQSSFEMHFDTFDPHEVQCNWAHVWVNAFKMHIHPQKLSI